MQDQIPTDKDNNLFYLTFMQDQIPTDKDYDLFYWTFMQDLDTHW